MDIDNYNAVRDPAFEAKINFYQGKFDEIRREIGKTVIGQHDVINGLIEALIANGHTLVEGIPGIGKTLLVKTMAKITGCAFSRIQFTPDLLPTDIVGVTTYEEGRGFFTVKGPIFANFVLADEINRSPPKVQSALLESMQEKQATIGKETFRLPNPFFVMATQNPIENLGTYKLPEAQVDRFLYKLVMTYPEPEDEVQVLRTNMTIFNFENYDLQRVLTPDEIVRAQDFVKKIYTDKKIENYIIQIVEATRKPAKYDVKSGKYIDNGGSPRASIALYIASKAHALLKGRGYVIANDVKEVAYNCLRHRILLNFEGEAESVKTDDIIKEILEKVPIL
ncbi:MoxR family ATPase [Candidatus Woesearchaeota archaeon]|nr:MoxR family ATPase [Candidatus Woesearchaeota archaeon]